MFTAFELRRLQPEYELPEIAIVSGPTHNAKTSTSIAYMALSHVLLGESVLLSSDEVRQTFWSDPAVKAAAIDNPSGPERDLWQKHIDDRLYADDHLWDQHVLRRHDPATGRSYLSVRQERQSNGLWELADFPGRLARLLENPLVGRVLLEGIAFTPQHIAELRDQHPKARPLVLVNTNPAHGEVILDAVRERRARDGGDWMCNWTDARILSFMECNLEMNHEWRQDAEKYGVPYRDMRYGSITRNALDNAQYLLYGTPLEQ